MSDIKTFVAGGKRTHVKERYDLICPAGHHSEALAMGRGAVTHGEQNWTLGFSEAPTGSAQNRKDSIRESLNHALKHINLYLAGDHTEDHLGHAKANLSFAIHFDSECICREALEHVTDGVKAKAAGLWDEPAASFIRSFFDGVHSE